MEERLDKEKKSQMKKLLIFEQFPAFNHFMMEKCVS